MHFRLRVRNTVWPSSHSCNCSWASLSCRWVKTIIDWLTKSYQKTTNNKKLGLVDSVDTTRLWVRPAQLPLRCQERLNSQPVWRRPSQNSTTDQGPNVQVFQRLEGVFLCATGHLTGQDSFILHGDLAASAMVHLHLLLVPFLAQRYLSNHNQQVI